MWSRLDLLKIQKVERGDRKACVESDFNIQKAYAK